MNSVKRKVIVVAGATLGFAALLGGTLGFATASVRQTTLKAGALNLVGGPFQANVAPDDFLSCLPQQDWSSLYIWDAPNQKWLHFFNEAKDVPAYVNGASVGGISTIPRAAGAYIFVSKDIVNPQLLDTPSENCIS